MKKTLIVFMSIMLLGISTNSVNSQNYSATSLSEAISLYKSGNYAQCYTLLTDILESDTANALAYYYMAITSAQVGKKAEAIENYDKVLSLTTVNNNLRRYAEKGKRCLETPEKCENKLIDGISEEFILSKFAPKSSEEVKSEYETLKIQNLMREINRMEDISPERFKEYKDFSSLNLNQLILGSINDSETDFGSNNDIFDLSVLQNSSMNSDMIKMLLTNRVSQSF